MNFSANHIYHLYNQGNNRKPIFYRREHYQYFLQKIKKHILPHAHILAWCLMPNHFHLLILVKEQERRASVTMLRLDQEPHSDSFISELNADIGIMLSSYTRAINKLKSTSGSLFRKGTKAIDLGSLECYLNRIHHQLKEIAGACEENDDLSNCFTYIHNNPVKAGLVKNITDWEFSSARELATPNASLLSDRLLVEKLHLDILAGS